MNPRIFKIFVMSVLLLIGSRQSIHAQAIQEKNFTGTWQGTLSVGNISLRLVFHFTAKPQGGYKATLDSPDQGAFGIPTDTVIVQDSKIQVVMKAIAGAFKGTRPVGSDSIVGTWSQAGRDFPLVLKWSEKESEKPKRPQEPKKPYPYKEEEVTFANAKAGILLAGTLTTPHQGGPFPAMVLISGSGPQDRDETVFGHKPFLVLADYLTRAGIAVLRYDDRGVGKSTGNFDSATTRDFAEDVKAGITFLKTRKDIRANCIGLIGHSEGAIIAPLVASESKDVALIVLLAGTGVPGEELISRQAELILSSMGVSQEDIKKNLELQRKIFAVVKSEKDTAVAGELLKSLVKASLDSATLSSAEATESAVQAQIKQINTPWFRYFLTYDPRPTLRKVRCPVLAIGGEKDLQVDPKQNLPEIESALRQGGNKDFTVKELPGLNHLFQTASTGAPIEYGKIEETLSPIALKLIADWILEKVRLFN